jgi:hypothetical protein
MNGIAFTVFGIGPEKFEGVKFAIRQDFWVPLMMQSKFNGGLTDWEKGAWLGKSKFTGSAQVWHQHESGAIRPKLVAASLAKPLSKVECDTHVPRDNGNGRPIPGYRQSIQIHVVDSRLIVSGWSYWSSVQTWQT